MIAVLIGLMQAVAAATAPSPSPSTVPIEALWLAGGGLAGAFVRAIFVTHQQPLSRETAFDCFLGLAAGLLWNVPMLGIWPLFELAPQASYPQRAMLMALVVVVGLAILKRALISWAPEFLERRLGAVLPKNGEAK